MSQRCVRLLAGVVASLVTVGVALTPVQSAFAATSSAPRVSVKAHRLASVQVAAHKTVSFTVSGVAGVPKTGVAAVVLKLTASKPGATGALVAYPAGAKRPSVLSVSFTVGHDATNVVVVAPGVKGKVTAYNSSVKGVRIIPTVIGYYRSVVVGSPLGSYFHPVASRTLTSTLVKAGGVLTVTSAGLAGVPAAAAGVVFQLSAVTPAKAGHLTVSPSGGKRSKVNALSFTAGRSATALVTAAPGAKGRLVVANTAKSSVRVRVDVVGYVLEYVPPAAAPTAVTAVSRVGALAVSWTASVTSTLAPVLHYVVTATPQPATAGVVRTASTSGPVTTATVTGLTNGVAYLVTVYAVTRGGNGTASKPVGPVTPATVPAAPTAVVGTASGVGQVTVTWTAPASNGSPLTGYKVTGGPAGALTLAPTVTTTTVAGLTVGQRYVFTVTAANALGSSAASAPSLAVIATGAPGTLVTSAVSVDTSEVFHGSGVSTGAVSTSTDGRFVAFSSNSGLAGTDVNGGSDVFLRDQVGGTTTLVSSDSTGTNTAGNTSALSHNSNTSISSDGSVVAFDSDASNLVTGDTNGREDVFARTIAMGHTVQVSLRDTGTESVDNKESYGPAISADGNLVAFVSNVSDLISMPAPEVNDGYNIYLRNLTTGTVIRVSQGTAGALPTPAATTRIPAPTISPDGRYIGYSSAATNIAGPDTNGTFDSYIYDTTNQTTTRVSVDSGGVQGNGASGVPSFSLDDRYAVFQSDASNLVAGDTNGKTDIFVRDLLTGTTTRVSLGNDGSQANDASTAPAISNDGTRVLFTSAATNLVVGDTNAANDTFVRYLATGETIRESVGANSVQATTGGTGAGLSGDGKVVLFASADALVTGDPNGVSDLFARTLG
jgi:Tol biopolymer transport system component